MFPAPHCNSKPRRLTAFLVPQDHRQPLTAAQRTLLSSFPMSRAWHIDYHERCTLAEAVGAGKGGTRGFPMAAPDVTRNCCVLWASFWTCRKRPSVVIGFKISEACILQEEDGQRLLSVGRCSLRILNSQFGAQVTGGTQGASI